MTAAAMSIDLNLVRRRTRWTMSVSTTVHALLFLWVILNPVKHEVLPSITEITLLTPGDLAPSGSPNPAPAAQSPAARAGAAVRSFVEHRFLRRERDADVVPEPQSAQALADQLTSRLARAQTSLEVPTPGAATTSTPASLFGTGTSPLPSAGSGGPAVSLNRGGGGSGPALDLVRGGGGAGMAPALLASPKGTGAGGAREAPAKVGESTARRTIAGASLMGPIADRAVLSHPLPVYPEWAKKEAVEGSVTLYFVVRPDGGVKENILVQKTAGFTDFDENARTALKSWRFEPLRSGRAGEQWGVITFHFRLRDVG
jgi:TonB family protein